MHTSLSDTPHTGARRRLWPSGRAALLVALLAALPALITLLILVLMRVDWADYVPWHAGALNDALYYWRQVYTFSGVGFDGGYYTINELPARAAFSHFYFYGPVFPMLYGTVGRVFGWGAAGGPILNTAVVTAALLVFGICNRDDTRRLRVAVLAVATFWPLLLFMATSMQEGVHMGLAVVLGAGFARLLRDGEDTPRWVKAGVALLLALGGLMRISWALLYLPFFLFALPKQRAWWRPWLYAGVIFVLLGGLFTWLSSPYPGHFTSQVLRLLPAGPQAMIDLTLAQIGGNLAGLFSGTPLELGLRAQLGALGLAALFAIVLRPAWLGAPREAWFHVLNLGLVLLMNVGLNDTTLWRDYRNLAPHVLLSLLVLVYFHRDWLVAAVIVSNALLAVAFVDEARRLWSDQFTYDTTLIQEFGALTDSLIVYDPAASNAWCNTVLTELLPLPRQGGFYPGLMALDPGIGVSFWYGEGLTLPLKSRWVFMTPATYERNRARFNFERVASVEAANIYRNLDANCTS